MICLVSCVCADDFSASCISDDVIKGVMVEGRVYDVYDNSSIGNANVVVTCNHNGSEFVRTFDTCPVTGRYAVFFSKNECAYGDFLEVSAVSGELHGYGTGFVDDYDGLLLDIGIVHVPMVPEFGFVIGVMTFFSAVGVFFFVRRG